MQSLYASVGPSGYCMLDWERHGPVRIVRASRQVHDLGCPEIVFSSFLRTFEYVTPVSWFGSALASIEFCFESYTCKYCPGAC